MAINSSKWRRFVRRGAGLDPAVRNSHFGRMGVRWVGETPKSNICGELREQVRGELQRPISVSGGCHSQLPRTWWLQTTLSYFHTVLEARGPKSKCQCCVPSRGSRRQSVPCLFQLPDGSCGCNNSNLCFCILLIFSESNLCLSLIRTLVIRLGAHTDNPRWSQLNCICKELLFFFPQSHISRFQGSGHAQINSIQVSCSLASATIQFLGLEDPVPPSPVFLVPGLFHSVRNLLLRNLWWGPTLWKI